jgi:hypothetical protein
MHRIDHATREIDKFGTGKDGFTEGSPPTIPATVVTDDIADAWQEELANLIELSGQKLSKGNRFQNLSAIQLMGPVTGFFQEAGGKAGEFHPHDPSEGSGTLWVTQTAGLTGEVQPGSVWLKVVSGRLRRFGFDSDQIVDQGLDSRLFTASKDTYLQISGDTGLITFVETALAAGEPAPGVGLRNVLKVVTDGTDITDVESLLPTWPELRARSVRFTGVDATARDSANEVGFLAELDESGGDNILFIEPWETGGPTRSRVIEIEDVQSGGTGSNVIWRQNTLSILPDGTDPRIRIRTHDGSVAEDSRLIDIRSAVGNITGAGIQTYATFTLPHDGANVFALVSAVDSSDATRTFTAIHSTLLQASGGLEFGTGALHNNNSAAAAVASSITTDGADFFLEFDGEAAKTWRITTLIIIVPLDVTA